MDDPLPKVGLFFKKFSEFGLRDLSFSLIYWKTISYVMALARVSIISICCADFVEFAEVSAVPFFSLFV